MLTKIKATLAKLNATAEVFFTEFPQAGPLALTALAGVVARFGWHVSYEGLVPVIAGVEAVLRAYTAKTVAKVKA